MFLAEVWLLFAQCILMLDIALCDKCEGLETPVYLNRSGGNITSPRYPSDHPPNQRCEWIFNGFTTGKVLQLSIKEITLGGLPLKRNILKVPNGDELEGDLYNVCDIYGVYNTIQNCSEKVKALEKNCNYYQLKLTNISPSLRFISSASSIFFKSKGFSLTYKIWDCIEIEETTAIVNATRVVAEMDVKTYIIVTSTIAIFIVICIIVALFLVINRKRRPARPSARRIDNIYETPVPQMNISYDSISAPTNLNRADMASYLSHSQLVQYPNLEKDDAGLPQVDGYVAMDVGNRQTIQSQSESLYTTMKRKFTRS